MSGEVVTSPTLRVIAGAELAIDQGAPRPRSAELGDEKVIHVDAHVVVVAKPPGLSTVPYGDDEEDTLEARVRAWLELRDRRAGRAPRRGRTSLGVVHRLDKETSGLIVFTRTWAAKQALSSQFRHHTVKRTYLAIAHGKVEPATFRSFLGEDRGDGRRGSVRRDTAGAREAVTHVVPLEALRGATLVACRLETGRTHQIRIHLSEAGHPLVGERVYTRPGPRRGAATRSLGSRLPTGIDPPRLMLHAAELGFVHPATERTMRWELAAPQDFAQVLGALGRE
jgi:23S rRNA pseudouridine1911/1915/1917 synthase